MASKSLGEILGFFFCGRLTKAKNFPAKSAGVDLGL
jgi:hypothetical protein